MIVLTPDEVISFIFNNLAIAEDARKGNAKAINRLMGIAVKKYHNLDTKALNNELHLRLLGFVVPEKTVKEPEPKEELVRIVPVNEFGKGTMFTRYLIGGVLMNIHDLPEEYANNPEVIKIKQIIDNQVIHTKDY